MPEPTPFENTLIEHGQRPCLIRKAIYRMGGGTALRLVDATTGKEVTRLTVNIPGVLLPRDEVVLRDFGSSDGITDVLETAGVVKRTGRWVCSERLELPICKVATFERELDRTRVSGQLGHTQRPQGHARDARRDPQHER